MFHRVPIMPINIANISEPSCITYSTERKNLAFCFRDKFSIPITKKKDYLEDFKKQ